MKQILLLLLLIPGVHLCLGQAPQTKQSSQARPNFSGTWVLNKYEITPGSKPDDIHISMVISHLEPEIRISRKVVISGKEDNQQLVYYTDGRGEKNSSFFEDPIVVKSKTKWNKDKLVSKASVDIPKRVISPQRIEGGGVQDMVEEWELSSDGKTLSHITKSSIRLDKFSTTPFYHMKVTRVYTRIS